MFTFLPEEVGSEVVRQQASKPGNADDFVCLSPMGDEIPELPDSIGELFKNFLYIFKDQNFRV